MTCHYCKNAAKKHGKTKQGLQRFRCPFCNKTFCEDHKRPLDRMRIKLEDAVFALKCLIEGNSVRSTERLTGLDRNTILDLLLLAGERCEDLMKEKIRNMHVRQVQADESIRERYSPGEVIDAIPVPITGDPDPAHISTSYVERQNLTMRMAIRRLTRLTNGFSKKWQNLKAALALHFAYYNFCRVHRTLRVTPGMAAGITNHIWTLLDLIEAA